MAGGKSEGGARETSHRMRGWDGPKLWEGSPALCLGLGFAGRGVPSYPRVAPEHTGPSCPACPAHPAARGQWGRLTYEGLDRAVDVLVLLEARGRGEGLPAVRAGVRPRAHMLGADVPLQVAGVREHLGRQMPAVCAPFTPFWWLDGASLATLPSTKPGRDGSPLWP